MQGVRSWGGGQCGCGMDKENNIVIASNQHVNFEFLLSASTEHLSNYDAYINYRIRQKCKRVMRNVNLPIERTSKRASERCSCHSPYMWW